MNNPQSEFARKQQDKFKEAWYKAGCSPARVAKLLGTDISGIYKRRANYLKNTGEVLPTVPMQGRSKGNNAFGSHNWQTEAPAYTPRIKMNIRDGYIVAFSDCHIWPGIRSFATDALMMVLKELKPKIVVCNGDVFDGASISRHDPLGWVKLPRVIDELSATKAFLAEVERITPKAEHILCAGNHDSRFDRRLASEISEFEDVPGMRLQDHLKEWRFCYSFLVNEDTEPSYFIHANRGGVHAPRNNVLAAGCTTFTGHLHSQKIMPVSTILEEQDGVDCGMLADKDGPQFAYTSSRPTDWREGFAVQRYDKDGWRYPAEVCRIKYSRKVKRAVFRGESLYEKKL